MVCLMNLIKEWFLINIIMKVRSKFSNYSSKYVKKKHFDIAVCLIFDLFLIYTAATKVEF